MLLSAVSVLVVAQLSSEVPEGLMNYTLIYIYVCVCVCVYIYIYIYILVYVGIFICDYVHACMYATFRVVTNTKGAEKAPEIPALTRFEPRTRHTFIPSPVSFVFLSCFTIYRGFARRRASAKSPPILFNL
jgi:hypothetical protein